MFINVNQIKHMDSVSHLATVLIPRPGRYLRPQEYSLPRSAVARHLQRSRGRLGVRHRVSWKAYGSTQMRRDTGKPDQSLLASARV